MAIMPLLSTNGSKMMGRRMEPSSCYVLTLWSRWDGVIADAKSAPLSVKNSILGEGHANVKSMLVSISQCEKSPLWEGHANVKCFLDLATVSLISSLLIIFLILDPMWLEDSVQSLLQYVQS